MKESLHTRDHLFYTKIFIKTIEIFCLLKLGYKNSENIARLIYM